jgi:hypothetical protein
MRIGMEGWSLSSCPRALPRTIPLAVIRVGQDTGESGTQNSAEELEDGTADC